MTLEQQVRDRIKATINMRAELHPTVVEDMTDEIVLGMAFIIEQLDVPIPIEEWQGTKREVSAATGRAIAQWFRDRFHDPRPTDV